MTSPNGRRFFLVLAGLSLLGAVLSLVVRNMRRNPSAYSFRQGGFKIPRPFLTRDELHEILAPRPGESLLEVGPGKGYYSLDVAERVSPDGTLGILDVQKEMLDYTMRQARDRSISNITAARADATALPYPDNSFDGAYLVAVLGEVPDRRSAVRELRRVTRPGGRIIVGEAVTDPHRVSLRELRVLAEETGLCFERKSGGLLGTFYRFRV